MEVLEWRLATRIKNSVNNPISLALIQQKAVRLYETVLKKCHFNILSSLVLNGCRVSFLFICWVNIPCQNMSWPAC
jgi:hypothetical protein